MTQYITKAGEYGDITLKGRGAHCNDPTDIPLMINAPNKKVVINDIFISDCWMPLQIRAVGELIINNYNVTKFMNDGLHICCSNVSINKATIVSNISKKYSNSNHPDAIQIFPYKKGETIENIVIKELDVMLANSKEHAGIHLTENNIYRNIFIGEKGIRFFTDAEYPYWFSATNLSNSIIGSNNMNVSGKGIRIKDVKNGGLKVASVFILGMKAGMMQFNAGDSLGKEYFITDKWDVTKVKGLTLTKEELVVINKLLK